MNPLIKLKIKSFEKENWPGFLVDFIEKNPQLFDITSEMSTDDDFLIFKNNQLYFHNEAIGEMSFDFATDMRYHLGQHYSLSKEPLAKALGLVGHPGKLIWDATCGTGKDAVLISHFKANIIAFERHPVVYLLLCDAKRRSPVNFEIVFSDSLKISPEKKPAVIYYDPMYPEKKKSALARKEMRIFKQVVGDDSDSKEFLEWALTVSTERVVVKRPLHALPIKENPTASYKGKSTRYDMYKIFS
jgi:16S rRNA (guanine1516-N2)-methyltransferase